MQEMSEKIDQIAAALVRAQKKVGVAVKGSANPFFRSKYADLGAVMEACKDPLNEEGIVVVQSVNYREGKNFVDTILLHQTGQYIRSSMEVVVAKQNDPQALGSAITYAKRYGLQAMVFVPSEDDDGNKAADKEVPKVKKEEKSERGLPTPKPSFVPKTEKQLF